MTGEIEHTENGEEQPPSMLMEADFLVHLARRPDLPASAAARLLRIAHRIVLLNETPRANAPDALK